MALKNEQTGEYAKILRVMTDTEHKNHHLQLAIFANQEQRECWEGGLSEYENYRSIGFNLNIDAKLNMNAAGTKTIKDNLITAGYRAMKDSELYAGWIDV